MATQAEISIFALSVMAICVYVCVYTSLCSSGSRNLSEGEGAMTRETFTSFNRDWEGQACPHGPATVVCICHCLSVIKRKDTVFKFEF